MKFLPHFGFYHDLEFVAPDGTVTRDRVHNLVPTEGMNLIANVLFKAAAAPSSWFVGLIESNYTPAVNLTAAQLGTLLTECTAYSELTRPAFTPGAVVGGAVDNMAARAEMTMTADKTLYGGFIISAGAKGGTSGTIISVARYTTPRAVSAGTVVRVAAGFSQTTA